MKRKKKSPIKALETKLWSLCKALTRKLHGNTCYTCGRTGLKGSDWHTGHMIPKSVCGAYLAYDLRVLRPQCATCNIWRGGMGAVFLKEMIAEVGQERVDRIFADKNRVLSAQQKIQHYENLLAEYRLTFRASHC